STGSRTARIGHFRDHGDGRVTSAGKDQVVVVVRLSEEPEQTCLNLIYGDFYRIGADGWRWSYRALHRDERLDSRVHRPQIDPLAVGIAQRLHGPPLRTACSTAGRRFAWRHRGVAYRGDCLRRVAGARRIERCSRVQPGRHPAMMRT